jgi:uncharacterized protein (TIGR02145 family)
MLFVVLTQVRYTLIAAIFFAATGASCTPGNQISQAGRDSQNSRDSVVIDPQGNQYPVKMMSDGLLWMTANLKLNIAGSFCYNNEKGKCEQYGRLYLWETAKQGCDLLGENWRLPKASEWSRLTLLYGGVMKDSSVDRKSAYKSLLRTGDSGFNAVLGGGRQQDGTYARVDAHGFYWTATPIDTSYAWCYNFAKGSQALYQQDGGEKGRGFSVRCVKSHLR